MLSGVWYATAGFLMVDRDNTPATLRLVGLSRATCHAHVTTLFFDSRLGGSALAAGAAWAGKPLDSRASVRCPPVYRSVPSPGACAVVCRAVTRL